MTPAEPTELNACPAQGATEEMLELGITRVPVDYFHCGEFRYTNLKDAVAQAKRQRHSG